MAELLGTCARERESAWAKLRGWGCGTQNPLRRAQRAGAGAHGGALPRAGGARCQPRLRRDALFPAARKDAAASEGGRAQGTAGAKRQSAPGAARGEGAPSGRPRQSPQAGLGPDAAGVSGHAPCAASPPSALRRPAGRRGRGRLHLPVRVGGAGYCMPDPRTWTQSLELPAERQNRLLGVLKAAEARGRVRALRLRYTRMRAEEIALLIQRQKSARAAIRLELFLPPQLKPTRIPDPWTAKRCRQAPVGAGRGGARPPPHTPGPSLSPRQRRRVETILEENVDGSIFPR
uniref:LKAAEAR motif containing 1 n=1 Tax=Macaca fascicularis TaxID=9541 RepID=A0A7N9CK07_MACFA